MLAIPLLLKPPLWLLIVKICPYRGEKNGEYSASEPSFYMWGIPHYGSIDESHTFQHRGKNGWTLTFPEVWARDLALANPESKAGDTER